MGWWAYCSWGCWPWVPRRWDDGHIAARDAGPESLGDGMIGTLQPEMMALGCRNGSVAWLGCPSLGLPDYITACSSGTGTGLAGVNSHFLWVLGPWLLMDMSTGAGRIVSLQCCVLARLLVMCSTLGKQACLLSGCDCRLTDHDIMAWKHFPH